MLQCSNSYLYSSLSLLLIDTNHLLKLFQRIALMLLLPQQPKIYKLPCSFLAEQCDFPLPHLQACTLKHFLSAHCIVFFKAFKKILLCIM